VVKKEIIILSLEKKHEKRKIIAQSTCKLFIEKGYSNITISELARVAGIGKGTIYEYFTNKEDIIFELMATLQDEYDLKLYKKLTTTESLKEKVVFLFDIFLGTDEKVKTQRLIYKEFLSIYIHKKTTEMNKYNQNMMDKYKDILENMFKEAIKKNEISEIALVFIPSIFATFQGFFIMDEEKTVIYDYIENLFKLFELKKELE